MFASFVTLENAYSSIHGDVFYTLATPLSRNR